MKSQLIEEVAAKTGRQKAEVEAVLESVLGAIAEELEAQPSVGGTSRISREAYVRICERLGVKFPGATRRSAAGPPPLCRSRAVINRDKNQH